ncbi:hypothetical protein BDR06DRAFT_976973 [Suillus hirtellus]|nr:hypothetical protein BDR06DRAFT_976973 [Suillus hirtellus]
MFSTDFPSLHCSSKSIRIPAHLLLEPHPYTIHPYTNSRVQERLSFMDMERFIIQPNLGDKGGAYTLSLQGASEMHPTAQHDTENTGLIYGHSTQQMMPSNLDTQKAFPHPFLVPPSVPLIYDLHYSPTSLCKHHHLHLRICLLTDTEWGTAGDDKRASLIRARDHRLWIQLALHGSLNPAPLTRPTVQQEPLLLCVDWLGSSVAFMGLVKDEAFVRRRLVPGGREPPETWVMKFHKL